MLWLVHLFCVSELFDLKMNKNKWGETSTSHLCKQNNYKLDFFFLISRGGKYLDS